MIIGNYTVETVLKGETFASEHQWNGHTWKDSGAAASVALSPKNACMNSYAMRKNTALRATCTIEWKTHIKMLPVSLKSGLPTCGNISCALCSPSSCFKLLSVKFHTCVVVCSRPNVFHLSLSFSSQCSLCIPEIVV